MAAKFIAIGRRISPRYALACAAAVAAVAGLIVGQAGTADAGPALVQSVSPNQAGAFAVFRQPAVSQVPAGVESMNTDTELQARFGANPALARATFRHGDPSQAWYVIPGSDSVCFYVAAASQGVCGSEAAAEAGKLLVAGVAHDGSRLSSAGATVVLGLVPDDVTAAAAVTSAGTVAADVEGNTLEVHGSGISSLRLTHADGSTTFAPVHG